MRAILDPSPEMTALARFYPDLTWSDSTAAGALGPGSPETVVHGRATHRFVEDGLWLVGSYEQAHYGTDGSLVRAAQLHWAAGWDRAHGEYRGTLSDNYGHASVLHGRIDGDRLVFESADPGPVRLRMVWDVTGPDAIEWRTESSVDGGPWTLDEAHHTTPVHDLSR